jgi:hypothetical protein
MGIKKAARNKRNISKIVAGKPVGTIGNFWRLQNGLDESIMYISLNLFHTFQYYHFIYA